MFEVPFVSHRNNKKEKRKKGISLSKRGARPKRATSGSKHARETRANNKKQQQQQQQQQQRARNRTRQRMI